MDTDVLPTGELEAPSLPGSEDASDHEDHQTEKLQPRKSERATNKGAIRGKTNIPSLRPSAKTPAPNIRSGRIMPAAKKAHAKEQEKKKKKGPAIHNVGIKKPHRFLPGTCALREIRRQQKSADKKFAIPRSSLLRLIREITQDCSNKDIRWTKKAVTDLQCWLEDTLVRMFAGANNNVCMSRMQTLLLPQLHTFLVNDSSYWQQVGWRIPKATVDALGVVSNRNWRPVFDH